MVITAVTLGAATVDLNKVLADVTIRHGRSDAMSTAEASSAQLTLLGVERSLTKEFDVGEALTISTAAGRRFTGYITDAALDDNRLTVLGIGTLARHSRKPLPLNWTAPAEPWSARVARVMGLAGLVGPSTFTIPYQASEWFTDPASGATISQDAATGATFFNFPVEVPAWTYFLPHASGIFIPIVKGRRYRFTLPYYYGVAGNLVVLDNMGTDNNLSYYIPAATGGPYVWDFVALGDSIAPGARFVFYTQQTLPGATGWTWHALIGPMTIAMLDADYLIETDPTFDPMIAARVAPDPLETEPQLLGDQLTLLADTVGALLCDMPDGRLLMQALGSRTSAGTVVLNPADVLYSPPWVQTDELSNEVSVAYPGGEVTLADGGSIAIYDRRRTDIATELQNAGDASIRGVERLARVAYPRWVMPSLPLLTGYTFGLGRMVEVTNLPPGSPYPSWHALVEGWTDSIVGPDWTMEVALSDALLSGLTLPWNAIPNPPNLVRNGTVEADNSQWVWSLEVWRDNAHAHDGSWSMKIQPPAVSGDFYMGAYADLVAGTTYEASVWVYAPEPTTVGVGCHEWGGSYGMMGGASVNVAAGWTRIVFPVATPPTLANVTLFLCRAAQTPGVGYVPSIPLWYDAVQIRQPPSDYQWDTIDQAVEWHDALTIDDLTP